MPLLPRVQANMLSFLSYPTMPYPTLSLPELPCKNDDNHKHASLCHTDKWHHTQTLSGGFLVSPDFLIMIRKAFYDLAPA